MKLLLLLALLFFLLPASAQNAIGGGRARELYQTHCAICHGANGQGDLGVSLIDDEWIHGNKDEDISKVIHAGVPDEEMPPFGGILNDMDIRSLVIFLHELKQLSEAKSPQKPSLAAVQPSQHHSFRLERVASSQGKMWGMDFLPDGSFIVTEIDGPVRIIAADGTAGEPIRNTPAIMRHGQGGMLDVAVHPDYAKNGWIYLSYAEGSNKNGMTALVRGRIRGGTWVDQEVIFRAKPEHARSAGQHFGSRIAFAGGYVFFSIGDRGAGDMAQNLDRPNGKIHRLHDDGRIPADNPFVDKASYPSVWSYGHRNPQGLAIRPGTNELWSDEHGPRGGDELNRILPGKNYGWPVITHGMNYDGKPISSETHKEGMEQPVWYWTPSIAVCGLAFVQGGKFPKWEGDLLVGGLQSQVLERLRPGADGLAEREVILRGLGRVRDVACAADGTPYLILEGQGSQLVRLLPAIPGAP